VTFGIAVAVAVAVAVTVAVAILIGRHFAVAEVVVTVDAVWNCPRADRLVRRGSFDVRRV